jgi:hypothetical protein
MTHNPTPPVSCRYGAPMGRFTGPEPASNGPRLSRSGSDKWHLRKIRLDSGGYDPGGAYWGIGLPLYWAMNQDGAEVFFRLKRGDYREAFANEESGWASRWFGNEDRLTAKHALRRD